MSVPYAAPQIIHARRQDTRDDADDTKGPVVTFNSPCRKPPFGDGEVPVDQCRLFGLGHQNVSLLVQLVIRKGKLSDLMQQVSALLESCDAHVPVRAWVTSSISRATASHADIMQTRVAFSR